LGLFIELFVELHLHWLICWPYLSFLYFTVIKVVLDRRLSPQDTNVVYKHVWQSVL